MIRALPSLFFLLPLGGALGGVPTKEIIILLVVAIGLFILLSLILGKRINIDPGTKQIAVEYLCMGVALSKKTFSPKDFEHISVRHERVYSSKLPIPAYKGAATCVLVGKENLVLKTSGSQQIINDVAKQVEALVGLPIQQVGEVLV